MSGRWLAKDPIAFEGGDTSLLSYSGADPVNFKDPTGLSKTEGLCSPTEIYRKIKDLEAKGDRQGLVELLKEAREVWNRGGMTKKHWVNIQAWIKVAKKGAEKLPALVPCVTSLDCTATRRPDEFLELMKELGQAPAGENRNGGR
jgi:hypothetical protein